MPNELIHFLNGDFDGVAEPIQALDQAWAKGLQCLDGFDRQVPLAMLFAKPGIPFKPGLAHHRLRFSGPPVGHLPQGLQHPADIFGSSGLPIVGSQELSCVLGIPDTEGFRGRLVGSFPRKNILQKPDHVGRLCIVQRHRLKVSQSESRKQEGPTQREGSWLQALRKGEHAVLDACLSFQVFNAQRKHHGPPHGLDGLDFLILGTLVCP